MHFLFIFLYDCPKVSKRILGQTQGQESIICWQYPWYPQRADAILISPESSSALTSSVCMFSKAFLHNNLPQVQMVSKTKWRQVYSLLSQGLHLVTNKCIIQQLQFLVCMNKIYLGILSFQMIQVLFCQGVRLGRGTGEGDFVIC